MGTYKEVEGDLIKLALEGNFDVVTHGCNCFCTMGAGIAPQMAKAFGCDKFNLELTEYEEFDGDGVENWYNTVPTNYKGDINKLGQIDYQTKYIWFNHPVTGQAKVMGHRSQNQPNTKEIIVVNSYTQYHYGGYKPLDYEALTMCMRKTNHIFKGKSIGLPQIGAGLAGGDWDTIRAIIQKELKDMDVTVVIYKP